jgi:hypothetical protein
LKLFLFVSLVFFLLDLFFPFPLTSLLSIPSHPSILNITSAVIISQKILNCTQYRDNNNTKGNDEKTEKKGNQFQYYELLSWNGIGYYQRLFLHLLRWSTGFCLCFC